jgi:prepilin-type N-terminal cleavage/methylation domain-containing protein
MRRTHTGAKIERKGMTLLELAVVATIAGLVLGIVLPKMSSVRAQMLLDSTAHEIARDLIRTRGEALKRNEYVSLKRSDDTAYWVRAESRRRLPEGVTFKVASSVDSVRFAPFGLVDMGVGSLVLQSGPRERRVTVRKTGYVRVE